MPVLSSPRHERFAEELRGGATVAEARRLSGVELLDPDQASGFYVYLLIDPASDTVFYVGQGKGRRAHSHERAWLTGSTCNGLKLERIGRIARSGGKVVVRAVANGLSEEAALNLEHWFIGAIGRNVLTNAARGLQGPNTRLAAQIRDDLKSFHSFCCVKERIIPNNPMDGSVPAEQREALYWDILGELVTMEMKLSEKPVREFAPMHDFSKARLGSLNSIRA